MGRTLLGIDLDESPVGGLIEGLLSEEDLEKLTDGGRDADADPETDASRDGTDDESGTEVGTDLVDDAVESDGEGGDTSESVPVGTSASGSSDTWDSPSPEGPEPIPSPGAEDVDDDEGGWKAKLRPILLKATAALVVLAVVAFVAYRFLGKAKSAAGDRFGSDEETDSPPTTDAVDADAPEARRRAKSPERDDREALGDRPVDETIGRAEPAEPADAGASDEDEAADDEEPESVGRPTADSDVGALVGLAALALVAAVVRKFGEDREYDPLVDGPADDGDDE